MLMAIGSTVNASNYLEKEPLEGIVQPQFTNISVFYNDLSINDTGKALITSSITAREIDEIRISTFLQKYEDGQWTTVKHWTTTQSGTLAVLGESWYVVSGYQYRIKSYGYVYQNGKMIESSSYTSRTIIY
jgi:hypothetical protein